MSSHAVGRPGLEDLELWLAGLFTAAEHAAAELLLQMSVAGGDGVKAKSTTSFSPRSASSWCDLAEDKEEVGQVVAPSTELRPVEEPAVSTELDTRARKRHRLLSDLYAATSPGSSAPAANKRKKRRHGYDGDGSSSVGGGDEVRGGD